MSSVSRLAMVETLETRAYAASHERVTTVFDDAHPATVVHAYGSTAKPPALPRITLSVDADSVIHLAGTYGDDSIRIRDVTGGVELRTYTRMTYTYFRNTRYNTKTATTTIENVFFFPTAQAQSLTFDGSDGDDALRTKTLRLRSVLPTSVESVTADPVAVPPTPAAPAGQTPSDPIVGGKWRPGLGWYTEMSRQKALADVSRANIAFFGDSHAERFSTIGLGSWKRQFPHALNLGIGGDSTRQMIARIQGGLFDLFKPKSLVISVGTNNFGRAETTGTDDQVYDGVLAVVKALKAKLPDTQIILVGLLPAANPVQTVRAALLNSKLVTAAAANGFEFLDIYPRLVHDKYAAVATSIGPDSHYTARGYAILGYQLQELMTAYFAPTE